MTPMRFRKALDQFYRMGLRDGAARKPPDPFMISSHPGIIHKDNRHFRRSYNAGWRDGTDRPDGDADLGFPLQGELPKGWRS